MKHVINKRNYEEFRANAYGILEENYLAHLMDAMTMLERVKGWLDPIGSDPGVTLPAEFYELLRQWNE